MLWADSNVLIHLAIKSQCVDGAIRLADGSHTDQGRVEVCYNGRWGTVNGDGWTSREARVVCRQLGYNLPETSMLNSMYTKCSH